MNNKKILRRSLDLHFLRPDNGLWVYSLYISFSKYFNLFLQKKYKSLDLGCGDGTSTYIASGGVVDKKFDVLMGAKTSKQNLTPSLKKSKSGSLRDSQGDFYDHYSNNYKKYCKIKNGFNKSFTYGIDWKKSLLQKAKLLNYYDKLDLQDCNKLPINLQDESLHFVFSTILYWLKKPKMVIRDINRVLKSDGIFIFTTPKEKILKSTIFHLIGKDFKNINRLDRGRHENWKRHAKKNSYWEKILKDSGFEIIETINLHPKLQIMFGETIIRTLVSAFKVLYKKLLPKNQKIFFEFKEKYNDEMMLILSDFADKKKYSQLEKDYTGWVCRKIKNI
tara:strand:+ start:3345 stop:4346 length:1002 start_codon:yes stop_codon:yes gene_type:complete